MRFLRAHAYWYHMIVYGVLSTLIISGVAFLSLYRVHLWNTYQVEPALPMQLFDDEQLFRGTDFGARGILIYDAARDKEIFTYQEDTLFGIASISKIMTALVALENHPDDFPVPITAESLQEIGDHGLVEGTIWRLRDIIEFMLITSSNDAAAAIAEAFMSHEDSAKGRAYFVERMNTYAQNQGWESLVFTNPTGLDEFGVRSTMGTARDVFAMMRFAYERYPDIMRATTLPRTIMTPLSGDSVRAENTNQIINRIPAYVFSKTGFTQDAGGSLVFIFERAPQAPVYVVILGSTFTGRFTDAEYIAYTLFEYIYNFENIS
ncbi:MAG: serine hydrolase [Candidatus Pacebacteria bacterium]|nr:serine hydrolase [Candidatus Paceibacterota bacterium]MCD8507942.1 serine hydrolase [Candidatus Paceibacterota bacterium]